MNWLERKKLFVVYNRAMAKALKSPDRVKIRQRLRLAFGIIQSSNYYKFIIINQIQMDWIMIDHLPHLY